MNGLTADQLLDKENFLSNFADTWYHKSIIQQFGTHLEFVRTVAEPKQDLPRVRELKAWMLIDIFWYIDQLIGSDEGLTLYDIGGGHDIFKHVLAPRVKVVTVDPYYDYADIRTKFDGDFEIKHQGSIHRAMAIDALHFRPITEFAEILYRYTKIFAKGGRGLITFNIARFIDHTSLDQLSEMFGTKVINKDTADPAFDYIEKEIVEFRTRHIDKVDVILVDITRGPKTFDEHMDGNIKIIFDVK